MLDALERGEASGKVLDEHVDVLVGQLAEIGDRVYRLTTHNRKAHARRRKPVPAPDPHTTPTSRGGA